MAKPKVRWFDDWYALEEIAPGPGCSTSRRWRRAAGTPEFGPLKD